MVEERSIAVDTDRVQAVRDVDDGADEREGVATRDIVCRCNGVFP